MTFADSLVLAIQFLLLNKMRSVLTALGVIFGVASVVAMIGISEGAKQKVLAQVESLGIHNIEIKSVKPTAEEKKGENKQWTATYGVTQKDLSHIQAILKKHVAEIVPVRDVRVDVWSRSSKTNIRVFATPPDYFTLFGLKPSRGRVLVPLDEKLLHAVCVLGAGAKKELFRARQAVGRDVKLGNLYCTVVGVLEERKQSGTGEQNINVDQSIFIPYQTFLQQVGKGTSKRTTGGYESIILEMDQAWVSVKKTEDVLPVAQTLENMMNHLHKQKDYDFFVPLELLRQKEETQRTFTFTMISIAAISLLVGGIGIMNIMLAAVAERIKEIGTRRALGARKRDVLQQFLMEATLLSSSGGVLGIGLGVLAATLVAKTAQWPIQLSPFVMILSLLISAGVGVLFGTYPALKAANLNPIEAIRYE